MFFLTSFVAVALLGVLLCNWWTVWRTRVRVFGDAGKTPLSEVGLVLGTQVGSLFLEHRLDTAGELFAAGKVRRLLVSGSYDGGFYDEAGAMRSGLIERGVPTDAIVCDRSGFRTLDSVVRARRVYGARRVAIVSQRFHLYRALLIARAEGMEAVATVAPDPEGVAIRRVLFREWAARVLGVLDLYIWRRAPQSLGASPAPEDAPRMRSSGESLSE